MSEDEHRLLPGKENKTFCEGLKLVNEQCPKEELLDTLNELIKNISYAQNTC